MRLIVATHPAPAKKKKKRQVGVIRDGVVSELFLTNLPQSAFTASDVVSLYAAPVGPLKRPWKTKTSNKSRTAGAATR